MKIRYRLGILLGAILVLGFVGVAAQGPSPAQIQAALRAFLATENTWTAIQHFNAGCTGCGGGGGTPGGADTSVQFNNGGSFGGFGTWDGSAFDVGGLFQSAGVGIGTAGVSGRVIGLDGFIVGAGEIPSNQTAYVTFSDAFSNIIWTAISPGGAVEVTLDQGNTYFGPTNNNQLDLGFAGFGTWRNGYFGTSVVTPLLTRDSGDLTLSTTTSGGITLNAVDGAGDITAVATNFALNSFIDDVDVVLRARAAGTGSATLNLDSANGAHFLSLSVDSTGTSFIIPDSGHLLVSGDVSASDFISGVGGIFDGGSSSIWGVGTDYTANGWYVASDGSLNVNNGTGVINATTVNTSTPPESLGVLSADGVKGTLASVGSSTGLVTLLITKIGSYSGDTQLLMKADTAVLSSADSSAYITATNGGTVTVTAGAGYIELHAPSVLASGTLSSTFISANTTPAVANIGANSCGTTAATISGTDNSWVITVGSVAGTACRVTFDTSAPNAWDCVLNNRTTVTLAATPRQTASTTTTADVTAGTAFVAGDLIGGICFAR